eukprot:Hpha_TRINITY_DN15186_c3_g6::TRINITY_DN15186_c3_g6_i2::g.128693::m.128693
MERRGGLDIILHPNSGCEVSDHIDWPLWGGIKRDLNTTCLHYQCPGCNFEDCDSFTRDTVLEGVGRRECGLNSQLKVESKKQLCSPGCQQWLRRGLEDWARSCPHNCDGISDPAQKATCELHLRALPSLRNASLACN